MPMNKDKTLPKLSLLEWFKNHRGKSGIRIQLLTGFLVFTAVTLVILWIFQIFLLNPFYEYIKTAETKRSAASLEKKLETSSWDEIIEIAGELSYKSSIYIRISDEFGKNGISEVRSYSVFHSYYISNYNSAQLAEIYDEVKSLDDFYIVKKSLPPGASLESRTGESPKCLILATTVRSDDSTNFLLLLETELTPLDATVDTLKSQLFCLIIVLLILGIILALLLARTLSRPIISINNSAKMLAKGNYDIVFPETGSKELLELAQTLNYAARELSKVESLRRELIANISHDLRTPLTMIRGYSEIMRDLPGENTPENVQIIIDETSRLSELVNDMLDLSKLESGTEKLSPDNFNLTQNIRDIIKRYDKMADLHFNFIYDEDLYVYADALKISQVIYNLINNAINYIGEDKTITLAQTIRSGRVRIEITDTGDGIEQDKLKDIWERYYKIDKEHKRTQVGTGLGLSIVKNILDMHAGSYGVESSVGKGSTFWFELPFSSK